MIKLCSINYIIRKILIVLNQVFNLIKEILSSIEYLLKNIFAKNNYNINKISYKLINYKIKEIIETYKKFTIEVKLRKYLNNKIKFSKNFFLKRNLNRII